MPVFEQSSLVDIDAVGKPTTELAAERQYVAMLYHRLDDYRARIREQLVDVRLAPAAGTHQWRSEREALAYNLERRLAALAIGDAPLCFGRLDLDDRAGLRPDELVVSVDAVKSNLRALFSAFGLDHLPQNQKRASLALRALRTGVVSRRDL